MNRYTHWLCAQAALLLLMSATLHAQTIVPVADFSPPAGHTFIIGLVSPVASGKILLVTEDVVYSAPVYAGSSLSFAKFFGNLGGLVNGVDPTSLVAADPQDATKLLFTNLPDTTFEPTLTTLIADPAIPTATGVSIDDIDMPVGLALDPAGAVYAFTSTGVAKYANTSTGTRSFTMGASGSGPGQLFIPGGALAVGPGGVLYALDPGNNRVVGFDTTTGNYLGNIPLTGTTATTALAVSDTGRVYTANGNGGGTVYDAVTGALLDTFSSSAVNPFPAGNTSILLDGRGYIYLYDAATGMHVFSDPASAIAPTMLSVADFLPVVAHSFVIGLVSPVASGKIFLVTVDDVYSAPVYAGSSLSFALFVNKLPAHVNGVDPTSLVAAHPQDASKLLFTNVPDTTFEPTLTTLSIVIPTAPVPTGVSIDAIENPAGLALDPAGPVYAFTITGVAKYANTSTGTRSFTMGASGSGAGELSIPGGALAVGPGGVLYALDLGNNRVVGFDTATGNYLGNILLTGTTATTALAVSDTGRVYTANGNGGGTVYDALTGAVLNTLVSAAGAAESPGGRTLILLDGRGYIYLYDAATGMHVFSDPSSVTAAADLAVTASGPAIISKGSNITYSVTVTNNGPIDAQDVVMSDALPIRTTFVSEAQSSGPVFTCTNPPAGASGSVNCTLTTLASGASAAFTLVFHVKPNIKGSTLTNTAVVSSSTSDLIPGNNSASTSATVQRGRSPN